MKARTLLALAGLVAVAGLASLYAAAEDDKLANLKCPISGKKVVAEGTANHKEGKVYFCCTNCPKAFAANPAKHVTKANHQLVASGQAKQGSCPFTGGKLNPETKITVDGADICFCCNNCKGKAEALAAGEKVEKLFGDTAFAKAKFAVAK